MNILGKNHKQVVVVIDTNQSKRKLCQVSFVEHK